MPPASPTWTLVVAMANNGVIGRDNGLPWKLRSDLLRFKARTMGHCLVMGRKTYESIGRPLPGRQTIVVSRSGFEVSEPAIAVVASLQEVAPRVDPGRQIMVVGGAQLYAAALPLCDSMWITRVLANVDGDTYFPTVDWSHWRMVSTEFVDADERNELASEFQEWQRVK